MSGTWRLIEIPVAFHTQVRLSTFSPIANNFTILQSYHENVQVTDWGESDTPYLPPIRHRYPSRSDCSTIW